jgi:hypothetical protein
MKLINILKSEVKFNSYLTDNSPYPLTRPPDKHSLGNYSVYAQFLNTQTGGTYNCHWVLKGQDSHTT